MYEAPAPSWLKQNVPGWQSELLERERERELVEGKQRGEREREREREGFEPCGASRARRFDRGGVHKKDLHENDEHAEEEQRQ